MSSCRVGVFWQNRRQQGWVNQRLIRLHWQRDIKTAPFVPKWSKNLETLFTVYSVCSCWKQKERRRERWRKTQCMLAWLHLKVSKKCNLFLLLEQGRGPSSQFSWQKFGLSSVLRTKKCFFFLLAETKRSNSAGQSAPHFEVKIGHFMFSQIYIPCWLYHRKPRWRDDRNVMLCHIGGDSWSEGGFFTEWNTIIFTRLSWSILPWNSSLAEKVCLGWRCTQMFPYCHRRTERPLTQRCSHQHHHSLHAASPEKLNTNKKAEEEATGSCLGILGNTMLWWRNESEHESRRLKAFPYCVPSWLLEVS